MKVRKLTRRQLAAAIAGAVPLLAQSPADEDPAEMLKQSVSETQRSVAALEKVRLPMSTEPAAVFRIV